jgi:AhpD family alkylhydroperoxidase
MTEAVAATVSKINACPYCVDAHTGMLHASADHDIVKAIHNGSGSEIDNNRFRRIVEWAFATRSPGEAILLSPPFSKGNAPEFIGTAVVYHFVNRIVNIFLSDSPLPVPSAWRKLRRSAVKIFGATVGKSIIKREPRVGESLKFIPRVNLPADMEWARPNSTIAAAFAGFTNIVESLAKPVIPEPVRHLTQQSIDAWEGSDMGMGRGWLEKNVAKLKEKDKSIARIALLSALAPHQMTEEDIQEFRLTHPNDNELLVATSWASYAAARRIGGWLSG